MSLKNILFDHSVDDNTVNLSICFSVKHTLSNIIKHGICVHTHTTILIAIFGFTWKPLKFARAPFYGLCVLRPPQPMPSA